MLTDITEEDVRAIEEAADTLIRLHAPENATRLYALALRLRTSLSKPKDEIVEVWAGDEYVGRTLWRRS